MQGIEIDVTAELTKENADLMQQIKKLKQDKKQLNKEIKLLKNVINRYEEALNAKMNDEDKWEYRGKKDMEIDYMEIDEHNK